MTPGDLVRSSRIRAGLTQTQLARRAGTSQPVISAYEHDRRDPGVTTLRRLLAAANTALELRTASLMVSSGAERQPTATTHPEHLVDVLLLADAIPARLRGDLAFPRLDSHRSRH